LRRELKEHETKIARRGLKYLDELVTIEEKKHNKREKKTKREPQLFVSSSKVSAPVSISLCDPQVDLLIDSDSAEALAAFDPLNLYWLNDSFSGFATGGIIPNIETPPGGSGS
jgi:hypothetical protein